MERPGFTKSERSVGDSFDALFRGCQQRIIVTTFASNVHRVQQVLDAAAQCGRKVAVTGRSMENMMKVSTELGYMKVPKNTLVDINKLKGLPKNKQVIVTTGSQGEEMSALYRMAFSTHKQVEIGAGDKVILSASAVPGNEVTVGRVINELFRKGATVVYDRADMLHVSGHACQEEHEADAHPDHDPSISCPLGTRTVQSILAVQLNFCRSAAGDVHCSLIFPIRRLNIHITEPDLEFLGRFTHPVIDDLDDIRGGVFDAALCRRISHRGSGGGGSSRRGVGLSGLRGRCLRLFRGAESGLGGLLLRLRVCRGVLVHHILLGIVCGGLRGVLILLGGVLALLGLGRVLPGLVQGKGCVRVRLFYFFSDNQTVANIILAVMILAAVCILGPYYHWRKQEKENTQE